MTSSEPAADGLHRGREAYAGREWADAYESFELVDRTEPLGADDLELFAVSAFMLARDDDALGTLERAHHAYLELGETLRAVRCAFWIGTNLAARGELGRATGWLGRAQRLLEGEPESVERGYLLIPAVFRHEAAGDYAAGAAAAAAAVEIAQRFADSDLFALAALAQGQMLIKDGRIEGGLPLLDEAMLAVTAGGPSPMVAGLVYCGVILACQQVYELRRAQEWTAALARWCDEQPGLVAFTGRCLIHRAEIMQVHGAWQDALDEARRAGQRLAETMNQPAAGLAFYRQGELHRLLGELDAAEQAYRSARRFGWEPQPGLALLRLAQGRSGAAAAAIRRATAEATEPLQRAALLPACVEIMLAVGETEEARRACGDLEEIAEAFEGGMLGAMVAQARGAVELAEGKPDDGLVALRRAWQAWQQLDAPYEVARVRVLVGLACRALGDHDAAGLELEAARDAFEELGASPDLERVDALSGAAPSAGAHGLTGRELEVLRLMAAGRSNREIASELVISEHTVARHAQNIFAKLSVSSRSAATAYAFEHALV